METKQLKITRQDNGRDITQRITDLSVRMDRTLPTGVKTGVARTTTERNIHVFVRTVDVKPMFIGMNQ